MVKIKKLATISKQSNDNDSDNKMLPVSRKSDDPIPRKTKWINKQRVLIFASRGINHRHRHLMQDLRTLLPHSKTECKLEKRRDLKIINEMCEAKNCNKCIFFEARKHLDLYAWFANVPTGPSIKFLVENVYTTEELKFSGNCQKGSRPLLDFDDKFDTHPEYKLIKEFLVQIFGTPKNHPKSQPFFDHIFSFTIFDNKIWFRNFQILSEDGAITEIGPRMVLNPIKIFDGSFGGNTKWENPLYITPSKYRQRVNKIKGNNYINRVHQKMNAEANKPTTSTYNLNNVDEIFAGEPQEVAEKLFNNETNNKEKPKETKSRVVNGKILKMKKKTKTIKNKKV